MYTSALESLGMPWNSLGALVLVLCFGALPRLGVPRGALESLGVRHRRSDSEI